MLLTDYFRSEPDATWDFARQSGVCHGVIRLPEREDFDLTQLSHWQQVQQRYQDFAYEDFYREFGWPFDQP